MIQIPLSSLISGLLDPAAYPHTAETIQLRETHISWVLLTGEYAYKVKKPVDYGFVDFTTLPRRRHFCEEEVRLNRRFSSDLYHDVVPITNSPEGVRVAGQGEAIEYAVRMRQFDERLLASRLLAAGQLAPTDIDGLARSLAVIHQQATPVSEQRWGTAKEISKAAIENVDVLRPLIDIPSSLCQLDAITEWTRQACSRLQSTFSERREAGFVRECHGDLHLGNIVNWHGMLTPFDCIEFNPAFRWIDVMNEVAFLMMDLDDHDRTDLGWRLLNCYLEQTGDYSGPSVLPFYLVYRAMVRAKVDFLQLQQSDLSTGTQRRLTSEWHSYIDLSERYLRPTFGSLTITYGVSGSGKTTITQPLLERQGAIRLRSDVERKRLFGLRSSDDQTAAIRTGIYSEQATQQTYDRLASLAELLVVSGYPVIVDATFLRRAHRRRFQMLARELGVPFQIVEVHSDRPTLQSRIEARRHTDDDASDATRDVLDHQLHSLEPLTDEERNFVISPTTPDSVPE